MPAFVALALAPDGKTLAYRDSNGGEICLWDVALGRQVQRRPGHDTWVQTIAVSPDGRLIASAASRRKQLRLWDTAAGTQLHVLQGHDEMTNGFIFSSDGKYLVSYGTNSGTFNLWDIASGKELRRIRIDRDRLGWAHAASLSADGKRLMAIFGDRPAPLSAGRLLAWDLATGKQRRKELDALWSDLSGNARRACRAIHKLTASPAQTVSFLKDHLRPPATLDAKRVEKLMGDLDSDRSCR